MKLAAGSRFTVRVEFTAAPAAVRTPFLPSRLSSGVGGGVTFERRFDAEPLELEEAFLYAGKTDVGLEVGDLCDAIENYLVNSVAGLVRVDATIDLCGGWPHDDVLAVRTGYGVGGAILGAVFLGALVWMYRTASDEPTRRRPESPPSAAWDRPRTY